MRIQSGQIVSLGYGRYVRSDDVVAVEPITEERGPGRRALVWARGVPDPLIASRSAAAIIHDLAMPSESGRAVALPAGRAMAVARKSMARKPAGRQGRTERRPAAARSRRA
jgi:hypothetical protein